jgi:hypothetical protein
MMYDAAGNSSLRQTEIADGRNGAGWAVVIVVEECARFGETAGIFAACFRLS